MARVKLIQNKEDIAPEHYALFDELAALRGRISGPSTVMLHSPSLAGPWNEVSEYLHRDSFVEAQHAELAVAATAREYDCPYIWNAHAGAARRAKVSDETIATVATWGQLDALSTEEAAVVLYVRQVLQTNRVDQGVFDALLQGHGAPWLVELTAWIGRYGALACVLNAFEVAPAEGAEPLPQAARPATSQATARQLGAEPRVAPVTMREQVNPQHQAVFDTVAESRGSVRGPMSILMHSPPLCQRIFDVANHVRFKSVIATPLIELATLATAREKDCSYVWSAHGPAALKEGIAGLTITAIRDHADISTLPPDQRDVVEYTRQILRQHHVDQALFDRMRDEHGIPWLVELTALIGHYGLLAGILNAFEVSPAPDAETLG